MMKTDLHVKCDRCRTITESPQKVQNPNHPWAKENFGMCRVPPDEACLVLCTLCFEEVSILIDELVGNFMAEKIVRNEE